jgi:integrase/recombinase XerD
MVVILLECGLRIGELCSLSLDCLIRDDKQEWYLRLYQSKKKEEHVIPLVNDDVVGAIQAQQQEIRDLWGTQCPYLFPSIRSPQLPYKKWYVAHRLNMWAVEHQIVDSAGKLYRFQSHQFRHTVGMRLINDGVSLDTISRLFNHESLSMTQRYARKRAAKVREELERVHRKRKTVNYQGEVVKGDAQANNPDAQLIRKGVRGQTLAVGGCGRLVVLGECNYANKCLTCPMWLTSTDDLPALKSFHERSLRLRQRATEIGNQVVVQQQEHIIANLTVRINSLQDHSEGSVLTIDEILAQLRIDLVEAINGWEEAQAAGLLLAAKHLERTVTDLKARITALEDSV